MPKLAALLVAATLGLAPVTTGNAPQDTAALHEAARQGDLARVRELLDARP